MLFLEGPDKVFRGVISHLSGDGADAFGGGGKHQAGYVVPGAGEQGGEGEAGVLPDITGSVGGSDVTAGGDVGERQPEIAVYDIRENPVALLRDWGRDLPLAVFAVLPHKVRHQDAEQMNEHIGPVGPLRCQFRFHGVDDFAGDRIVFGGDDQIVLVVIDVTVPEQKAGNVVLLKEQRPDVLVRPFGQKAQKPGIAPGIACAVLCFQREGAGKEQNIAGGKTETALVDTDVPAAGSGKVQIEIVGVGRPMQFSGKYKGRFLFFLRFHDSILTQNDI